MAPPALSTRDTRTSLYTYPPTLALSILSSGSRYYSLAPALPTHGSMMLDLPLYIYIYISVRFNPTLLRFSFLLLSSPRPYVSLSLLPYPLATTYRLFNSVSGSPCLLYRATARGLLYRENDSLESRSRKLVSSARGGASSFSLTRLSPLPSLFPSLSRVRFVFTFYESRSEDSRVLRRANSNIRRLNIERSRGGFG